MTNPVPLPDDLPYEISTLEKNRAIVRFAEICDHERSDARRTELRTLVSTVDQIVCDLTQTRTIVSGWIRLLEHLSVEAERSGKRFVIAGMSNAVKESADVIGVGSRLKNVETVDKGWDD